jgi:hypothetical protein
MKAKTGLGLMVLLVGLGTALGLFVPVQSASAHHILGRPGYSLNEDSNTPPSVTIETQAGGYALTYMVFPDIPRPQSPGRINFYAAHLGSGKPYPGKVKFLARLDSWKTWFGINDHMETIGVQSLDDAVFRQGVLFGPAGDYIITAEFEVDGKVHQVDFPMRVGIPDTIGPIGFAVGALFVFLIGFGFVQRRRALTGKIREHHDKETPS